MVCTKQSRTRGRPRQFELQEAVATARHLFHVRGYDAVSVAEVTGALGINPPSFYAAFGSKAELFARVLEHWEINGAIPLNDILGIDRPVVESLAALLVEAAHRYAADSAAAGCLVLEGIRCNDPKVRATARAYNLAAERVIHDYIAARHPDCAGPLTDFVSTTMSGLSAKARGGHSLDQLLSTARIAGVALERSLKE